MPLLRAEHQVAFAIAIPIGSRGRWRMTRRVTARNVAFVYEQPLAIALSQLTPEDGVFAVGENVEFSIAVPIGHGEFAASARAELAGIEAQRCALLIAQHALAGEQHEFSATLLTRPEAEPAFVIHHHEIGEDRQLYRVFAWSGHLRTR